MHVIGKFTSVTREYIGMLAFACLLVQIFYSIKTY